MKTSEIPSLGQVVANIKTAQVLKINEVCALTRLSRASIYRLSAAGEMPAPIKTGIRASGWRLSELETWLASRPSGVRPTA